MSADNGIYILVTKDKHKRVNACTTHNMLPEGVTAYRIAHAQAIDNLNYYIEKEPHNVGYYFYVIWGDCDPIYDRKEALETAFNLQKEVGYTEYGVTFIECEQYRFPGY